MKSIPGTADIVIIGGGIIGVSTAYHLAKKGVKSVVLLEKGMLGDGSTGKCAGGIRTQFSTRINLEFSRLSLEVFNRFKEEFGVDPEFQRIGYLFLTSKKKQWSILKSNAALMGEMNLPVELLGPGEIKDRWPFIQVSDILGGSYTENDGYAGPHEVLQGFAKAARRLGARLYENNEVIEVGVDKGKVCSVTAAGGEKIHTPVVVNATGAYSGLIAEWLGLDLPVRPLRRQLFFTDHFHELPETFPLIVDLTTSWYIRRERGGLLLAGPQDSESSFNEKVDFDAREWTARHAVHRIPVLEKARIVRGWAGLYEISPDNHAVIGSYPEVGGFICASGFSGHGFMHSPAAGLLVSELAVEGEARSLDITPLNPLRFAEGKLNVEPMTAFSGIDLFGK